MTVAAPCASIAGMRRLLSLALALAALTTSLAAAPVVYRLDLHDDMIDASTAFYFARAYARAEAAEADAIIIDIDTPGGRLDSCLQVRNRIFESEIPTYAHVRRWAISAGALIALATDGIQMGSNSTIGGSQPVTPTGGMDEVADEKTTSILRAEVRATLREQARTNPDRWSGEELAHLIRITEAMITPPEEDIPSRAASGEVACRADELLTLDWEQAVREGVADGRVDRFEDVLAAIGMEGAEVRTVDLTWSEGLARFLNTTAVASILLMIGLGALYLEFKVPGLGLPTIVAIIAFTLYFFGTHVADLSTIIEPLLVLVGIAFVLVEIFVLPGFGVAGLVGLVCIVAGLTMAFVKLPPPNTDFQFSPVYMGDGLVVVAFGMALALVPIILLAWWLPRSPLWSRLDLTPATIRGQTPPIPVGATLSPGQLIGMSGVVRTDLRPAGTVDLDGHPFDVVTQGEFIAQGTAVRVIDTEGTRIVVAAIPSGKTN